MKERPGQLVEGAGFVLGLFVLAGIVGVTLVVMLLLAVVSSIGGC